jgi:hypothetical protein
MRGPHQRLAGPLMFADVLLELVRSMAVHSIRGTLWLPTHVLTRQVKCSVTRGRIRGEALTGYRSNSR